MNTELLQTWFLLLVFGVQVMCATWIVQHSCSTFRAARRRRVYCRVPLD